MTKSLTSPYVAADQANAVASAEITTSRLKNLTGKRLDSKEDIEKASAGFEGILVQQMLKAMWATVQSTGFFGENTNEGQIYRDMLHQAIADDISQGKGIGVKSFLNKELSRIVTGDNKNVPEQGKAANVQANVADTDSRSVAFGHLNISSGVTKRKI